MCVVLLSIVLNFDVNWILKKNQNWYFGEYWRIPKGKGQDRKQYDIFEEISRTTTWIIKKDNKK